MNESCPMQAVLLIKKMEFMASQHKMSESRTSSAEAAEATQHPTAPWKESLLQNQKKPVCSMYHMNRTPSAEALSECALKRSISAKRQETRLQDTSYEQNPLCRSTMGWLRLVGSFKLQVSFAKEPYKRDYILQKRLIILRSLLTIATPDRIAPLKEALLQDTSYKWTSSAEARL